MRALAIAATGMNAQQLNTEVIANNIANINTTSFKRGRAEFTDLLYQTERTVGTPAAGLESVIPEGVQVGLGVRTTAVRNLHIQGPLASTGNTLDLALNGRGWFQVQGANAEILYTRAGSFSKDAGGRLVTQDGMLVEPQITIPQDSAGVVVNEEGRVFSRNPTDNSLQEIGQLSLANFANEAGLEQLGRNLYRATIASGRPLTGTAGSPGFANIQQGFLENSNVDPVKEITQLISAQRAYEMNSKVIQAADEMLSTVVRAGR